MYSLDTEMLQESQDAVRYGASRLWRHGVLLLLRWTLDEAEV
jgi:hypothetical protein